MMKTLIRWFIIYVYRGLLRPVMRVLGGPLSGCRFHPSCSQYFLEAVEIHGAIKGSCLGLWRILRCNPWGGSGEDPVPPRAERKSRRGAALDRDQEKGAESMNNG